MEDARRKVMQSSIFGDDPEPAPVRPPVQSIQQASPAYEPVNDAPLDYVPVDRTEYPTIEYTDTRLGPPLLKQVPVAVTAGRREYVPDPVPASRVKPITLEPDVIMEVIPPLPDFKIEMPRPREVLSNTRPRPSNPPEHHIYEVSISSELRTIRDQMTLQSSSFRQAMQKIDIV